jgi:hypothetical protein
MFRERVSGVAVGKRVAVGAGVGVSVCDDCVIPHAVITIKMKNTMRRFLFMIACQYKNNMREYLSILITTGVIITTINDYSWAKGPKIRDIRTYANPGAYPRQVHIKRPPRGGLFISYSTSQQATQWPGRASLNSGSFCEH